MDRRESNSIFIVHVEDMLRLIDLHRPSRMLKYSVLQFLKFHLVNYSSAVELVYLNNTNAR
jgi:hypothetical protein